jgi:hypothetical protein
LIFFQHFLLADMVARKAAIINNVKQELAVANAQELMNVITLGCHTRCVVLHSYHRNPENVALPNA